MATFAVAIALAAMMGTSPEASQRTTAAQDSVVVRLGSGAALLSPATTQRFLDALRVAPGNALHGLAALRRYPSAAQRRSLAGEGVDVTSPLRGRVYRVRISKTFDQSDSLVRSMLLWLTALAPEHRVAPDLWKANYSRYIARVGDSSINYLLQADSALRLTVIFHRDVTRPEIDQALAAHARGAKEVSSHHWRAVVRRQDLRALAALDIVRWIDAPPAPSSRDNDNTRGEVDVDEVQDFSVTLGQAMGLAGRGIQVGVFDEGIDEAHLDFHNFIADTDQGDRVVASGKQSWHGTLIGGIIAGNGYQSDKKDSWDVSNGTSKYRWRGMAPSAELLDVHLSSIMDVDPSLNAFVPNVAATGQTVQTSIANHGMDLSNHSYSWDKVGVYGEPSAQRDSMIRGDAVSGGLPISPRLQVMSAGNLGGSTGTGPVPGFTTDTVGYFSVNKTVKNGLVVGSWRVSSGRITGSSSLGPTFDGRISPDVIAPGSQIKSTGYWDAGTLSDMGLDCTNPPPGTKGSGRVRQQFYGTECGTSLAAPVVTGILALVLEHYVNTYGVSLDVKPPLPSTLRGIIVHSADDIPHPGNTEPQQWFTNVDGSVRPYDGPDFATGFGLANAEAAVDLVSQRLLIEDEIDVTCDADTFQFTVTSPIVRATLVWDDVAGEPATPVTDPLLRNDLDLVLIDPAGTRHYPWLRNQIIKSSTGAVLTPAEQTCDNTVIVERRLNPPGPVSNSDLDAASIGVGPDHLNTVEQVVVEGAVQGKWRAVVSGFKVEWGPQRFSLIGVPRTIYIHVDPHLLCKTIVALCRDLIFNFCKRYPGLCEKPRIIPIGPRGMSITFRDPNDLLILPMRELCAQLGVPNRCEATARTSYEIRIDRAPIPLGIGLYSAGGQRIGGPSARTRSARMTLQPAQGGAYFLLLSPPPDVVIGRNYVIPLNVRAVRR